MAKDTKVDAAADAKAKAVATNLMADGIFVRSVQGTFRRAGISFDCDGHGIALELLSAEQLAALENEPNLVTERCQFPMDEGA